MDPDRESIPNQPGELVGHIEEPNGGIHAKVFQDAAGIARGWTSRHDETRVIVAYDSGLRFKTNLPELLEDLCHGYRYVPRG